MFTVDVKQQINNNQLLSINYVITSLYIRYRVVKRIENNAVFIFLQFQTESKTIVKENILQNFCFNLRTAGWHRNVLCLFIMEIVAYKGRPFSVFIDGFVSHFALLQLYSHHLVLSFSKYRGRIE